MTPAVQAMTLLELPARHHLTPAVQAISFLCFLACSGAERVESWTKELSSSTDLKPDANGSDIQKMLAGIANRAQEKKFSYNKFFAIGLFRMLELTGGQPDCAQAHSVPSCNLELLPSEACRGQLDRADSRDGGRALCCKMGLIQTLCKLGVCRLRRLSITAFASSAAGAANVFLCQEI